jgi:hypothetical protein
MPTPMPRIAEVPRLRKVAQSNTPLSGLVKIMEWVYISFIE